MKILDETFSFCEICSKKIPAKVIVSKNKVFLKKNCSVHGISMSQHVWDDPETYKKLKKMNFYNISKSDKVIINLTNKCNMNCPVCFAKSNELDQEELSIEALEKLNDFNYVYLTGGEPTTRKDLMEIIKNLRKKNKKVVLFTNGIKLNQKSYVRKLKKEKITLVILQFDSLDDNDNIYMRGMKCKNSKLMTINNLRESEIPVYTNSVILKNKNLNKINDILEFLLKIENVKIMGFSPLWKIGRSNKKDFSTTSDIIDEICETTVLTKQDFYLTTEFLLNLEYLLMLISKKNRLFSKCVINCLVLHHKGEIVPLKKIFNLKKINSIMDKIINRDHKIRNTTHLISYLLWNQILKNLLTNRFFRYFISDLIKNVKYIFKGNPFLLNPLKLITVTSFPDNTNPDMEFIKTCNLMSYSFIDDKIMPGCIFRMQLNESKG